MPPEQRGNQVGKAEEVKRPREQRTRDTVQRAGIPGDLRSVDGQVRAHGSAKPLGGEDGGVRRDGFGCDRSVERKEREF